MFRLRHGVAFDGLGPFGHTRLQDDGRFNLRLSRDGLVVINVAEHPNGYGLAFQKMSECCERLYAIADDLDNGEHGYGQNRTRHAPHPIPENK